MALRLRRYSRTTITYWHVELMRHDIILAEGLPVESYLETGDRSAFSNGGAVTAMFPDFAARTWEAEGCAPLVVAGAKLASIRDLVAARRRGNSARSISGRGSVRRPVTPPPPSPPAAAPSTAPCRRTAGSPAAARQTASGSAPDALGRSGTRTALASARPQRQPGTDEPEHLADLPGRRGVLQHDVARRPARPQREA